ncbi:zinc finger BED domain-containing protein RICESLEEPER 4-like [Salvia splendens]|uniref:zinc finger BED domain-containing protein RICESLEEPER 4-like n=1 Tax=Salvia splendens TaxID=180675 RepID=UPI001C27C90C|nr:zinc finger BED domain-containing protein RICESLEEPER 4-like [Salvia splendens]
MLCDESEAVGDTIENNATEDTSSEDPQDKGDAKKRKTIEKRSEVWDHFTPFLDNNKKQRAKCVHCAKTLCGESKNDTSSLKAHLSKCNKISTTGPRQTQLVLQSGQSSSLSSWNFEQEEVRKALAYMIIVDELPFKFVEGEGFKYFCLKSCP